MRLLVTGSLAALALVSHARSQARGIGVTPEVPPALRAFASMTLPSRPYLSLYGVGYDAAVVTRTGDFDRNGDPDVLIGPLSGVPPRLLLNDGNGSFTEVTNTHMPSLLTNIVSQGTIVDLDGDGDLDFVGANYASVQWQPLTLLANDGMGRFNDVSSTSGITLQSFPRSGCASVVSGDFDGRRCRSGRERIRGIANEPILLLAQERRPGVLHVDAGAFPMDNGMRQDEAGDLLCADLDRDGDLDLVSPGFAPGTALWLNYGTGRFSDATTTNLHPAPSGYVFRTVALGDVDRDGDLDLAASRCCVLDVPFLFLNDGRGQFLDVSATQMPLNADGGDSLQFADFDDDGDLDLLSVIRPNHVTRFPGEEQLLLNDGAGWFTLDDERRFFGTNANGYVTDLLTEDFDADGDVDVIFGSHVGRRRRGGFRTT